MKKKTRGKSTKSKIKLFPGLDAKKGRIVLNDFKFLLTYISELKEKKKTKENPKQRKQKKKILNSKSLNKKLKKGVKAIIREHQVAYGKNKFKNPNHETIINKEEIKKVGNKTIKEVETKTIKRNRVRASNKLPLHTKTDRKNLLGKFSFASFINHF